MIVKNLFAKITTPAKQFVSGEPPAEGVDNYEELLKTYEEEKERALATVGVKSIDDMATFKFSLGSIVFDIVNQAIQLKIFVPPASPKLQYRQEREMSIFAANADIDGEIEIPEHWVKYLDQILSDDDLFRKIAIFGEVIEEPPTDLRKNIPLMGIVINSLPEIRAALIDILPQ